MKIGDLIEIPTKKGRFYAQYTHHNAEYGELLRVFATPCDSVPDLEKLRDDDILLTFFFPLRTALRRKIFKRVANFPVREDLRRFPIFRTPALRHPNRIVHNWLVWDGEKATKVGPLTEALKSLPILGVWDDLILIHRLENGYDLPNALS